MPRKTEPDALSRLERWLGKKNRTRLPNKLLVERVRLRGDIWFYITLGRLGETDCDVGYSRTLSTAIHAALDQAEGKSHAK